MKINKQNYEAYILDYYEKNLSTEQVAELMLFLEQNPVLKEEFEEFEEFEDVTLEADLTTIFEYKESIRKPVYKTVGNITSENYEDFIISDLEKIITNDEKIKLDAFIESNQSVIKDYTKYRLTYLKPDLSIVFPDKRSLKKPLSGQKTFKIQRLYYPVAIAASVALMVGIFWSSPSDTYTHTNEFAAKRNSNVIIPEKSYLAEEEVARKKALKPANSNKSTQKSTNITAVNKVTELPASQLASNTQDMIPEMSYSYERLNNISFEYLNDDDLYNNLAMDNQQKDANFKDISNYFVARMKNMVNSENEMPDTLKKINGWDLADVGIEGFNKISQNEFDLKKEKAEDGTVQSYTFTANKFEFSRKLKKVK